MIGVSFAEWWLREIPMPFARDGSSFLSRRVLPRLAVAAAMVVALVLTLVGLTDQMFWDDEANTAIYARNLLELGKMTAWDGTNLVAHSYGGALGEDLGRELRVPPLPAYVAAAGMAIFGKTTFGGRILFALSGVVSVGLLAVWLRRFFGRQFPWYLSALILALSPAFLLYARNCRYYAVGVLFTLAVWTLWTPGKSRGCPGRGCPGRRDLPNDPLFDRRSLLRYLGAAVAMSLLIFSHYLNAATVLATLPLFFLDPRFRRKKQVVLLGIIYGAAALCAVWILLTVNPFSADYSIHAESTAMAGEDVGRWVHFYSNLGWLLRDLGTHEFLPWCLVPVLILPWLSWLPIPWFSARMGRLRPIALRGSVLIAVLLVYVVLAAALTPADMGKGPMAEMRYVVPLIALGAALSGLALVILWRLYRPAGMVVFVLLVGTNWLHLGFLGQRSDDTKAWWPPTLVRYVTESLNDYQTGNEAIVALLQELPAGTTVRIWPDFMTYPSMFYARHLHYCDQLVETKRIDAKLKPLPDYLYVRRVRPDVILTPAHWVHATLADLDLRYGPGTYLLRNALPPHWSYTSKPEIPTHLFRSPPTDWSRFAGVAVLVRWDSPIADHAALNADPTDVEAGCRMGITLINAGLLEEGEETLRQALQIDPDHVEARFHLATLLMNRWKLSPALLHFQTVLRLDPEHLYAHLNLGVLHLRQRQPQDARRQFYSALRIKPDSSTAHYNLGNIARNEPGGTDRAISHYRAALRSRPEYARAHVNLGATLLKKGLIDESINHLVNAIRIEPSMVEANFHLARALVDAGEPEAAIEQFQKTLDLAGPNSPHTAAIQAEIEKLEKEAGG